MRTPNNAMRAAKTAALGTTALTVMLLANSGAWAQNCTDPGLRGGLRETASLAASAASSVVGSISNVGTAFLAQQGSAFVSAPGNPPPSSPGGGVWVRGVGGVVDLDGTSSTQVVRTPIVTPATDQGVINCTSREHATFAGVQVGQDIARLNLDGWNLHLGTTAGYLESRVRQEEGPGTFRTNFEVPFIGTYAVATKGGFFADAMVRREFYNIELNDPSLNLYAQSLGARGLSVLANAGYQMQLPNNWFIEPSAGIIWSRTDVDAFSFVGVPGIGISGTVATEDIDSKVGRLTLRTGTSFTTGNLGLQPFASASVFREFADDAVANQYTCAFCVFGQTSLTTTGPVSYSLVTSSSRIGTWAQFSLGVAGQVLNTGWLGFVRGDYRIGENLEGWTGNAGLRYQFIPEAAPVVAKGVFKAPPLPVVVPVNWTGFYFGGFFGTAYGTTDIDFIGTGEGTDPRIAGWIGGGQVGYNYQVNRVVLGIEGDLGVTNAHGSKTCGAGTGVNTVGASVGFSPFFLNCSNELDWIATVAGRLGITWDRTLLYVKGGGAWSREETVGIECIAGARNGLDRTCRNPALVPINAASATLDRAGLLLGFGSEFAFNANWSAKAEYNFIRFREEDVALSDGTAISVRDNISTVKIGVNYRFGPAAAPVVAKY